MANVTLHTLSPNPGANRPKKRLGRGHGSGLHKTSGKGTKGQKARTGHHGIPKPGFEGGQTAMARRLPKRGFNNPFRRPIFAVNLGDIGRLLSDASVPVDLQRLKALGLVPKTAKEIKILGTVREGQTVPPGLTIRAHHFSRSAKEQLLQLGGGAEVIKPAKVQAAAEKA